MEDIRSKVSQTMEIIQNSPQDLESQILQDRADNLSLNFSESEFVIFVPGYKADPILNYVDNNTNVNQKMNLVIWSYNLLDTHTNVISIPYIARPKIKICRNTDQQSCSICLCIHQNKKLMNFLRNGQQQLLEAPKIIPSARKYIDPAINIISILSYGEVFPKEDKNITEADIKERINEFLSKFYIYPKPDEIDRIFGELVKTGIIIRTKGSPIRSYHLPNSIRKNMTANESDLIADVTKRAINKLSIRSLDQFLSE